MSSIPKQDVTGVILAGGMGRRMGGLDKGQIRIKGAPIIQHVIEALRPQVEEIIINANRHVNKYEELGCRVVEDELRGYQGPLAGFSAAMHAANTPYIVTVPCDGPYLSPDLVTRLSDALVNKQTDIAVARDSRRMQPVYALIKTALLESLDQFLESGERKIDTWYAKHKFTLVDFSDAESMFRNINTPDDQKSIEAEGKES